MSYVLFLQPVYGYMTVAFIEKEVPILCLTWRLSLVS